MSVQYFWAPILFGSSPEHCLFCPNLSIEEIVQVIWQLLHTHTHTDSAVVSTVSGSNEVLLKPCADIALDFYKPTCFLRADLCTNGNKTIYMLKNWSQISIKPSTKQEMADMDAFSSLKCTSDTKHITLVSFAMFSLSLDSKWLWIRTIYIALCTYSLDFHPL